MRPGRLQFEGTRLEGLLVAVDEQEVEASVGEIAREGSTHAHGRAGDDGEGAVAVSE